MGAVDIQVIAYAPTVFYHCQHCEIAFQKMGIGDQVHREHAREALPEDLRHEYGLLSDWVHDLIERYGSTIKIRVVDAASIEGFFKSLKYRARRYPAVIVDGSHVHTGADFHALDPVIQQEVADKEVST
jgi:hypothetical protein